MTTILRFLAVITVACVLSIAVSAGMTAVGITGPAHFFAGLIIGNLTVLLTTGWWLS